MLQREHVAVDQIQVSAFFGRNPVQVLQFADIVGGHPTVLSSRRITGHATGVVAAKKTFQIELHEIRALLVFRQKGPGNGLFPSDDPGVQRVFHEFQALLLNIGKARLFQVSHHVRRDSENSSNLIDLKFASF